MEYKSLCAAIADCVLLWRKKSLRSKQGLRLCSLRRIIGTAMPVRGVERKTMANSFDDWLLKNYTNFVEQNDDSSARNKKPLTVDKIY
ncbi:MAG: hypothetical protein MJY52_02150 [Bacteroidaceae bacterium]|nr:hypothetical protein [Bacteroidaceae bacterium]